jgi:hypothetical protein
MRGDTTEINEAEEEGVKLTFCPPEQVVTAAVRLESRSVKMELR